MKKKIALREVKTFVRRCLWQRSEWVQRRMVAFLVGAKPLGRGVRALDRDGCSERPGTAPVYELVAHHGKLVDIALCLVHEAERLGSAPTQFQLLKALFIADRTHLNRYGRPVSYDRYRAMRHGPVAMTFYNMLMEDERVLAKTGGVQWSRRLSRDGQKYEFFAPRRPVDEEWALSQSDIRLLRAAMKKVITLGNRAIWKETHLHPAYVAAYRDNDEGRTFPMDLALFYNKPDWERAQAIAWQSRHQR